MPRSRSGDDVPRRLMPTESVMSDIQRLLAGREFTSLDEVNAFLQRSLVGGRVEGSPPGGPLDRAQDLMYRAWEDPRRGRRIALAREALEVSADCADAWVMLAEEFAKTPEQAAEYYAKGVAAGERAIGREAFKANAGHFWGLLETRPYMRARLGLAQVLLLLGRHDDALGHLRALLRLNPGDNQGVRYVLAAALAELVMDGELRELLDTSEYRDDGSAAWLYARALVAFRLDGDSSSSRRHLAQAKKQNAHVPAYLSGAKPVPRTLPDFVGLGDEDEAVAYAAEWKDIWRATPGAIAWPRGPKPRRGPRAKTRAR